MAKTLKLRHHSCEEPNTERLRFDAGNNDPVRDSPKESFAPKSVALWEDHYLKHGDLAGLPRSRDAFRKIEADPYLSISLPKPSATAGGILAHAIQCFERLLAKNKPMTFKFGFTHCAHTRFYNPRFGYKHAKVTYDYMVVLYAAANPHGPAFLEAALVEKYSSSLFAIHWCLIGFVVFAGGPCMCNACLHPAHY